MTIELTCLARQLFHPAEIGHACKDRRRALDVLVASSHRISAAVAPDASTWSVRQYRNISLLLRLQTPIADLGDGGPACAHLTLTRAPVSGFVNGAFAAVALLSVSRSPALIASNPLSRCFSCRWPSLSFNLRLRSVPFTPYTTVHAGTTVFGGNVTPAQILLCDPTVHPRDILTLLSI